MVALGLAAVVVTALSMLVRGSSRVFFEEHRIAESQLEIRFAAERLRADLQRAGYLASANTATDPNINPKPAPALLGVFLEDAAGDGDVWLSSENDTVHPDRLRLLGAFNDSETYLTQQIVGTKVQLDGGTESARRWAGGPMVPGLHPVADPARPEIFDRIFKAGSFLRIENPAGFAQIIPIASADSGALTVTLADSVVQAVGLQEQGVMLLGRGHRVNVLNYIDYQVVPSSITSAIGRDETDARKTDLVRRELLADGVTPVPDSERVIAEYVVDFQVGFLVDDQTPPNPPELQELDFAESAGFGNPERIRGLRFRVSARTREEDPQFPWIPPVAGEPLTVFKLEDGTETAARVRSIEASMIVPGLGR